MKLFKHKEQKGNPIGYGGTTITDGPNKTSSWNPETERRGGIATTAEPMPPHLLAEHGVGQAAVDAVVETTQEQPAEQADPGNDGPVNLRPA